MNGFGLLSVSPRGPPHASQTSPRQPADPSSHVAGLSVVLAHVAGHFLHNSALPPPILRIRYQGHVLAKELVAKALQTTVITDSAVFAMISRVNVVIVGAHAIMANGGVIAPVGINMVALAAQRHAVPFVVVAGSHKECRDCVNRMLETAFSINSYSEMLPKCHMAQCNSTLKRYPIALLEPNNFSYKCTGRGFSSQATQ